MSISAVVTAVAALVVAVLEVRNEQQFQKRSVEPYIGLGNTGGEAIGHYAFLLTNNGLGPAVIKSATIYVDGSPVSAWNEAVHLATDNDESYPSTLSDVSYNRRIRAAETVEVFRISDYSALARSFHKEMNADRVQYHVCYCSIYEECWRTVYGKQVTHQPVSKCE